MSINYCWSCLLAVLWSCSDQVRPLPSLLADLPEEEQEWPAEQFEKITMIFTDSSRLQLSLFGEKLARYPIYKKDFNVIKIEDSLSLQIYSSGTLTSTLIAKHALIFEARDVIEFRDSVNYKRLDNGLNLTTNFLIWDRKNGNISVPGGEAVKIVDPEKGHVINGFGLTSNGDFSKYRLRKVSGVLQIATEPAKSETGTSTDS